MAPFCLSQNNRENDMPTNIELAAEVEEANAKVASMEAKLADVDKKFESIMAALNVAPRKIFEPAEHDPNEYSMAEPVAVGDDAVIEKSRPIDVDSPEFKKKAETEAFMREKLHIVIHQTSEKNADQVFDISVNGKSMVFRRGHEYEAVPRMFVEGLARAKPVNYENEEYTDVKGVRAVRHPGRRGLRYGFSVIRDPNPKGQAWLKKVLAEA